MKRIATAMLACIAWLGLAAVACAAPIKFYYTFAAPSGARITGSVTFESTLLANPGGNEFFLPNPAVLDIQMTVTGAGAGNGSYGLGDFTEVIFDTNGATLDLNRQLVGQATSQDPWGVPSGNGGDFNFFSNGNAPNGIWYFTLSPEGYATEETPEDDPDAAVLQSLASFPPVADVPTSTRPTLLLLAALTALAGVVSLARRRTRS